MNASKAKSLKEVDSVNTRLKRFLANAMLNAEIFQMSTKILMNSEHIS